MTGWRFESSSAPPEGDRFYTREQALIAKGQWGPALSAPRQGRDCGERARLARQLLEAVEAGG
jgi:hypothetical protein